MATSALPETYKRIVPANRETNTPDQIKELPLPKPGKNQILVQVEFAPINPSDIANLLGGYKNPQNPHLSTNEVLGGEGSGVVVAVGEELKVPHQVGEKVHIIGQGTWSQYHLTNSEMASKVQEGLALEQAACHIVNPGTVHYMAELSIKGGHKAAIHSVGSSALGRMLIRYLKLKGVKSISIVRNDDFIEELKQDGADYVLNSQSPDFEKNLKEIAEKEHATIAFDAIAGDYPNILLRNMPPGSIVYVYGGLSGKRAVTVELGELFFKKSVTGLYVTHHLMDIAKEGRTVEVFKELTSNLDSIFKSNIEKVFPLEHYKEALAYYKDNSSKGKILLKPN